MKKEKTTLSGVGERRRIAVSCAVSLLLFLAVGLVNVSSDRTLCLVLAVLTVVSVVLRFRTIRERFRAPFIVLFLYLLLCGVSCFYAVSGKFALNEFVKLLTAFCLALLLLAWTPGDGSALPARRIAAVLALYTAWIGLASVDMVSTRLIGGAFVRFFGLFTQGYTDMNFVEDGVRLTGLWDLPNVFAGTVGLGVLLALPLARGSAREGERMLLLAALYVNAVSFLLAFSLGASGMIAAAFLVLVFTETRERRAGLLILMAETLVLSLAAAGLSASALHAWEGPRPLPLLCLIVGSALLYLADRFVGRRLEKKLEGRGGLVTVLFAGLLGLLALFAALAFTLTGEAALAPDGSLRRAIYPPAGECRLEIEAEGEVLLNVSSQSRSETMTRTRTQLYEGDAHGAVFTVPEESLVVWLSFTAPDGAQIRSARWSASGDGGTMPLRYRLLPDFMALRLQGLRANQNAMQRRVFVADGLKLFGRSPVVGLGLGAFENAVKSVQPYYYETKYAHNHYVQALAETGVIGLTLFVGSFAAAAVCVIVALRRKEREPLAPALAAAYVFMAAHAAIELTFSGACFLTAAFGIFALTGLCCPPPVSRPRARTIIAVLTAVSIGTYAVFLAGNIRAKALVRNVGTSAAYEKAIRLDRFEWADYMASYVLSLDPEKLSPKQREQTEEYLRRLGELDSNTMPYLLAEYYAAQGRWDESFAMLEKYLYYVSSDVNGWNRSFLLLARYLSEENAALFREETLRLADMLEEHNARSLIPVVPDEAIREFIDLMRDLTL